MKPLAILFAILACVLIFDSLLIMLNAFETTHTSMEAATVAAGVEPVEDSAAFAAIDMVWAIGGVLVVAALIIEAFG